MGVTGCNDVRFVPERGRLQFNPGAPGSGLKTWNSLFRRILKQRSYSRLAGGVASPSTSSVEF
jgi:hypothetical protein